MICEAIWLPIQCHKKWCVSIVQNGPEYAQTKEFNFSFNVEFYSQILMNVFFFQSAWLSHPHYRTEWSSNSILAIRVLAVWKTTLSSWPILESPRSHLHIDFARPINGQCYFIFVGAYRKFSKAVETILMLKQIFCRVGIALILLSDNDTAFTSATFSNFLCSLWYSTHLHLFIYNQMDW